MDNINLSTLDLIILVAYIVFIILWAFKNASRKNPEGYFLGGRKMTWPVVGISMFAMMVSSSAIVGWAGDAYSTGISVFNYGLSGGAFILIFFLVFILPFYLKSKVYTMPEFLEKRFDSRSKYYLSFISLIAYIFGDLAITLYAGSLMLKMVFPALEIWMLIWMIAVLSASYTIFGGLASVMKADMIQAGILIFGCILVTVFAFDKAGGWDNVMNSIDPGMISLVRPVDDPSVPWPALLISIPILGFYFWCTSQAMVQKTLSSKNLEHARLGNIFSIVLMFVTFFVMILPGIAGRIIYPELERGDMIFPTLAFDLLPNGLIGLIIAAFVAAIASTISGILTSASTLFTMDFAPVVFKNLSKEQLIKVGRISGLVIISIAALWAPMVGKSESIIKYFQEVLSYLSPPIVAIFLLGVFWKRINGTGAFAGLVGGFLIALFLVFFKEETPLGNMHFLYVAPVILVASFIVIITVSLMTKAQEEQQISYLVWKKSLMQEESVELKMIPWFRNYRILAALALLLVFGFMFMWW